MADVYTNLAITLSFITTFYWFKIWVGNIKAAGANRKWSPEDKVAFDVDKNKDKGDTPTEQQQEVFTKADRWSNINSNDWENIPWALFVFWAILIIGHELSVEMTLYLSIIHTVFRLLHTVFYAFSINPKGVPLRSLMYGLGQLTAGICAIMLPIGACLEYA